jgi:hypothetical protein
MCIRWPTHPWDTLLLLLLDPLKVSTKSCLGCRREPERFPRFPQPNLSLVLMASCLSASILLHSAAGLWRHGRAGSSRSRMLSSRRVGKERERRRGQSRMLSSRRHRRHRRHLRAPYGRGDWSVHRPLVRAGSVPTGGVSLVQLFRCPSRLLQC